MFSGWQSFYQMTGEVSATLIGLLFIVASFTSGRPDSPVFTRGVSLFTTPVVFHLASILVISALALVPDGVGAFRAAIMTGWALLGFGYAIGLAMRIFMISDPTHWSDSWCYGAAPALTYLALVAATGSAWVGISHGAYYIALCLIVLLLVTIRNAWDLITWLAPRRNSL